jgi:hypothetical protein
MEVTQRRDEWCAREFGDRYDEDLAEQAFYLDAAIMEHDSLCCCDEPCFVEERKLLRALTYEGERRVRLDIYKPDPNRPSFEERYAPFGLAWQEEQCERMGGRA